MTVYELLYILLSPFLSVHKSKVRQDIRRLLSEGPASISLLDVGARASQYTIGMNAKVTMLDIPRESEIQNALKLGYSDSILQNVRRWRSNIEEVIIEDMTETTLPSESFDILTCIEVIEHVPDDATFVKQMHRVLKPSGILYLTTPNGDYIKNEPPRYNPDHLRHYTKEQLTALLLRHFDDVTVEYGVKTGIWRRYGQYGFRLQRPFHTLRTMLANRINRFESYRWGSQPMQTAHLFATAGKSRVAIPGVSESQNVTFSFSKPERL